jgi:quercetin 2,3-dioxygenase
MTIEVHTSDSRGSNKLEWLDSKFSFSFNDWYDPTRMGFGVLRVLNDDIVAPGGGFPPHSHANMEIVTIVLEGACEHRDSSGGHGVLHAGEVQHMSAGRGVIHSEYNHSETKPLKLLQIWIEPKQMGIPASYEQKKFDLVKNKLVRLVDGQKNDGALYIHQSATFWMGEFDEGQKIAFNSDKGTYVFVIDGEVELLGKTLGKRDAAAVVEKEISIAVTKPAKILIIEVPMNSYD